MSTRNRKKSNGTGRVEHGLCKADVTTNCEPICLDNVGSSSSHNPQAYTTCYKDGITFLFSIFRICYPSCQTFPFISQRWFSLKSHQLADNMAASNSCAYHVTLLSHSPLEWNYPLPVQTVPMLNASFELDAHQHNNSLACVFVPPMSVKVIKE
jgi:hypothetical protein